MALTYTTGLVGRWIASAGVSTSGTDVTGWADQIGSNDLIVSGTPQYEATGLNGGPCVYFDGTSYAYRDNPTGLPAGSTGRTIFVVGQWTEQDWGGVVFGTNGNNTMFGVTKSGNDGQIIYNLSQTFHNSGVNPGLDWISACAWYDAGACYMTIDGVATSVNGVTTSINTGTDFLRFASVENTAVLQQMRIAEVLIYDHVVGESDRISVENYFYEEYGISLAPVASDQDVTATLADSTPASEEGSLYTPFAFDLSGLDVLFVVDDSSSISDSEYEYIYHLSDAGITPYATTASEYVESEAYSYGLVIVAPLSGSPVQPLLGYLDDPPVPIVIADMRAAVDNGYSGTPESTPATSIDIVDASHPIVEHAGLASGAVTIYGSPIAIPDTVTSSDTYPGADEIATSSGTTYPALYAYERYSLALNLDTLGSRPAPARRAVTPGLALETLDVTPAGLRLLDGAVAWALGLIGDQVARSTLATSTPVSDEGQLQPDPQSTAATLADSTPTSTEGEVQQSVVATRAATAPSSDEGQVVQSAAATRADSTPTSEDGELQPDPQAVTATFANSIPGSDEAEVGAPEPVELSVTATLADSTPATDDGEVNPEYAAPGGRVDRYPAGRAWHRAAYWWRR